ncbi:asparaginase [Rugosimonospora acidiphila]|uniref:Asparaginase n=1 Tax=Rugosimonospora acidiphila TaxID=556531 RepID=A0ABP9SST2_9ACTN
MAERILLLANKDTIAYRRRPGHEDVASGAQLLDAIGADLPDADVSVEDVLSEPGWDTTPATMMALARRARAAILDDGFAGVVITHGVDTLEDTAFLIDLLAGPAARQGAIVITGAMRPLDDLSSDGPRNLAGAIAAATDPTLAGAGVAACLNDELHAARWVTLVDAAGIAAFSSAPHAPIGRIVDSRVEPLGTPPPRPPEPDGEAESEVALIKTYPGIEPALLTTAVDRGARGIVLEGTGMFNVPGNLLVAIGDLIEEDIPVVIASRCHTRPVDLAELPLIAGLAGRVGAIGARGLAPGKARAALMVALGSQGGVRAARDWFQQL